MRTYMIIPTYWTGEGKAWSEGDAVYDHPTPLDEEGTLRRTLKSLEIIDDKDFTLIILAAATNEKYIDRMSDKLSKMISEEHPAVDTILVTDHHLVELRAILHDEENLEEILSLRGYSNIRNLCLFIPYILDAEVAILIDDDEVFEDPAFISKAKEFVGKRFYGNTVDGVAGYYLNEDNQYYDKVNIMPWMTYWDRFGGKREAFDKIIGASPRLKITPFAFGGAMVIHRNLMRIVPFDPKITRGEDTDYVINSRIFGFNFYLDNELAIKHLPPPKNHPIWKRFREDIYRFLYDKSKFDTQDSDQNLNLHEISPQDFDPYPGEFMKPDLGDKIFKTNIILALNYLADGDVDACRETINNIYLARYDAIPHYNTYNTYLEFQKKWRELLSKTKDFSIDLKNIILQGRLIEHDKLQDLKAKRMHEVGLEHDLKLPQIGIFKDLSKIELRKLFFSGKLIELKSQEYVYQAGEIDNCVYIVLKGDLNVINPSMAEQNNFVIAKLHEADHFNETSIFFQSKHLVSIQAETDTLLMCISRDEAMKLLNSNTPISNKLLWQISRKLSERLRETTEKFTISHDKSSDISDSMEE